MPTNTLSHNFPTMGFPTWNYNYLDGSAAFFYALHDLQNYNRFVDAVRERQIAALCLANTNQVIGTNDARLAPYAVAGDYILGGAHSNFPFDAPYPDDPQADNTAPNPRVGWGRLKAELLNVITGTGDPAYSQVYCAPSVRVNDPTTPASGLNNGSNVASFSIAPFYTLGTAFDRSIGSFVAATASNTTNCLTWHLNQFWVPQRTPLEIEDFSGVYQFNTDGGVVTNTAAIGQAARFVGDPANFGTSVGRIWLMGSGTSNGGWYQSDAGGTAGAMFPSGSSFGLPDIIETAANPLAHGGFPSDMPYPGDRFDAWFLQRLRDQINMTVGFYIDRIGIGATAPVFMRTSDADLSLMPATYVNTGSGTGATLAAANAAAMADYASLAHTNTVSAFGASWNGYTSGSSVPIFVDVTRGSDKVWSGNGTARANWLPNNSQFACQIFYGWTIEGYSGQVSTGGHIESVRFNNFGDNVVDRFRPYDASQSQDQASFLDDSGIIAAGATAYTSASFVTATTFPNGVTNGATQQFDYYGYRPTSGEPRGATFVVVRFDVVSGFKYTKDYTGY